MNVSPELSPTTSPELPNVNTDVVGSVLFHLVAEVTLALVSFNPKYFVAPKDE